MAEYIDTSINPADYIEVWEVEDAEHGKQLVMAVDDLKCLPPADVRSVVRGRWEISYDGWYPYCPVCKEEPPGRTMTPFCPMCGADMSGGDVE